MALQLWETFKESIVAFTGLCPATFFTVLALGLAVDYVVSGLFGSLSDRHQRPRDYQEQMQPLPPPVQPVEPSEDELKQHDGTDPKNSLSMADKGQIYDVSQRRKKYDVFVSFRGSDVRKNFISHLYTALDQRGINSYYDIEELKKGEKMTPAFMEAAIKESQSAIVVFSENYASSRWLLDELAIIMEHKEQRHLKVFPVFYKVESREVRTQRDDQGYGQAMAKHKKFEKDPEKVKKWKKALLDAGSLSGYDVTENGMPEATIVKAIVEEISELKKFDVFLSFRGKDVRENINNLHRALVEKGINTFMDTESLRMGQDFPRALKDAIEQSHMYIVVFSKNYAGSWWCLKELVQILERSKGKQLILPIFYQVEPWEVREQKQNYDKEWGKHLIEFGKRKVDKWKLALTQVAKMQGKHLRDEIEDDWIPRIVEEVEKMMAEIKPKPK